MPAKQSRPKKPYKDFPLTAHPNGQWCKKIRGKQHYFGTWNDPDSALREYLRTRDDRQAGRTPAPSAGATDLGYVCNAFLTRSEKRVEQGEISLRTFRDYHDVCQTIVSELGRSVAPEQLRPADFREFRDRIAHRYSPSRLTKIVTDTRMVLTWAYESELLASLPRFGPDFKGASRRIVRSQRRERAKRLFRAANIRTLLEDADTQLRAMVLLGVNGGMGNTDVARLPQDSVDLDAGWIRFPRPKTGVERNIPLWSETTIALRAAIKARPAPSSTDFANRVFLTRFGNPWVSEDGLTNQVSVRFRKLLESCNLYRKGIGFYALRHTFQTIGDEAKDPLATAHVMGHADGTIGGVYRERISDERLLSVTNHVHNWLWPHSK